ncbi:MAG: Dabb family protein [Lachnospiraceae bacterium]|nr:Dabb family protein [Lachnospiraceae bacterium]
MVKHIILWNLKDEYDDAKKEEIKAGIKKSLEALNGVVPGLIKLEIVTKTLPSATCDLMLYSELESPEALKGYAVHPDHVHAADTYVRPYTKTRTCIDYEC